MKVHRYAWKLLCGAFHKSVITLEIAEIVAILGNQVVKRFVPEFNEFLERLDMFFAIALIVTFIAGLLISGYLLHSKEEKQKDFLSEKLRPKLFIHKVAHKGKDGIWRISVHNLSGRTVRFSAQLKSISPRLEGQWDKLPTPAKLLITHTDLSRDESEIAAGEDHLVDILSESPGERLIGITAWSPNENPYWIPSSHYEITIVAFPKHPTSGATAWRSFCITPQPDGTVILSDSGKSYPENIMPMLTRSTTAQPERKPPAH